MDTNHTALFAGGCFWCMEGAFRTKKGVIDVISGYAGGTMIQPTYKDVYTGRAGAREAVLVSYDATVVSYAELVEFFFTVIDPTDGGGQFADRGHSYTTAIFYGTDEERNSAEMVKEKVSLSGTYGRPITVGIETLVPFYPAEVYHQRYEEKNKEAYEAYYRGSGRKDYFEGK